MCCQLRSTTLDAQCDKLTMVSGRTKLTILATVQRSTTFDRRPWLVYHTERPHLCIARCAWGSASRESVCVSWHLFFVETMHLGVTWLLTRGGIHEPAGRDCRPRERFVVGVSPTACGIARISCRRRGTALSALSHDRIASGAELHRCWSGSLALSPRIRVHWQVICKRLQVRVVMYSAPCWFTVWTVIE